MTIGADVSSNAPHVSGRWRQKLSVRLLAWFLLLSLAPLLVTNAIGYMRSETILERQVERSLAAITEVQVQHIRDRIDHNVFLLRAIVSGNDFLVAGALRAAGRDAGEMGTVVSRTVLDEYLRDKLADLNGFDALYFATREGRVIGAASRWGMPADSAPGPMPDHPFTASVVHGAKGVAPRFRLAIPVHGPESRPLGYLGASINMPGSRDFLRIPEHLAGHIESFIVDERGRPIFVSHPHGDLDYDAPLASPLVAPGAGTNAHYRDRDGVEVVAMVTAIPGLPWRFLTEAQAVEALGPLRQLRNLSLVLELIFMALLVVTAWIVARDIVAPLHRLVEATRRVGRGDLGVRLDVQGRDEISELGHAFNDMASALNQTTARVKELHQREIERASQLATVGELASGVAHEIKNPVVGVANGLDLVRRRVGPDAKLTPIVDEMSRQLARVQETLQELLTFARPATPTLAPCNINRVVERALRLAQSAAEREGVSVDLRLDPTWPRCQADEDMLYQAFVNLLMNAVEATPCGRIAVTTRRVGDDVEVEIADTGRGIPAADLDHVFKPFFTTRHTGTGLGLPITRQIVERHGGQLTLVSREGLGTTVTIRLPLREVGASAALALVEGSSL